MFRTNGPAARSIGSDRGEQQQGKGKGKEADTSVPGEDEESLRSVQVRCTADQSTEYMLI